MNDPTVLAKHSKGEFFFWLHNSGSAVLRILDETSKLTVFQKELGNLAQELNRIPWDMKTLRGEMIRPGKYTAVIQIQPTGKPSGAYILAIPFAAVQ